jgi:lipopolysaccharide export system protein LptA
MRYILTIIPIVLVLVSAFPAVSAPVANSSARRDRSNLPITIKSNELSADNKGKTAIFTGKVVAKQGDITIFADKLTVNYGDKKGEVDKIAADGNVRIIQENRTGIAAHALYESKAGRITLTGKPRVMQGSDTTTGKTITYLIDDEMSIVKGDAGERVETTIHPPAKK